MLNNSLWIVGPSRSGKTERLVREFCVWVDDNVQNQKIFYTNNPQRENSPSIPKSLYPQNQIGVLVFAPNGDNRRELADKIVTATWGRYPVKAKTPLGFFQDEVILFWPLLIESLQLKAQFPVRLRPETEQELATKLWRSRLDEEMLRSLGMSESRLVRRILDLLQLAALSGTPCEDIPQVLTRVLCSAENYNLEPEFVGSLLLDWRNWCLDKGFLTYGIITEVYGQHLLSDNNYLWRLKKRYQAVLADDVQDYPALMRQLFELILDGGVGTFSYNPDGIVRLGLGADPNYMEGLSQYCHKETLTQLPMLSLSDMLSNSMTQLVTEPMTLLSLPGQAVVSIETTSRAALLQETADKIITTVKSGIVEPRDIAIIAPGLDAIARYSLIEMLSKAGIVVDSLQDKRPLISSPVIRALLTLITLVYPGLGRLVDRDAIAEMLVVLTRKPNSNNYIDPVRAGLIADYCFQPHPENPNLLRVDSFERWDRLGYAATTGYEKILKWLEQERSNYEKRLIPTPVSFLYGAIEYFMSDAGYSNYEQLANLRQLLETAQHYWEINTRLKQFCAHKIRVDSSPSLPSLLEEQGKETIEKQDKTKTIAEFITLLRQGTVTASPYPIRPIGSLANAITLATIFQYRSLRHCHRYHFWLDAGSPLWVKGGAATLFGSMFFVQDRFAQSWNAEDEKLAEDERLQRIIADLLARVSDKIYLCHSELAVNGQEQLGALLPLVNSCVEVGND